MAKAMGGAQTAQSIRKQRSIRGLVSGIIAFGIVFLIYSLLFPLYRFWDYGLAFLVSIIVAIIFNMMARGIGLQKSKLNPEERLDAIEKTGNPAIDELISRGQDMMVQIRMENELIPDEVLSNQMDELEKTWGKILRTVSETPGKAPQIRKFMNYYMPTTLKMLKSYRMMDEKQLSGEKAADARKRIEEAMSVVLAACKKQLETLYHDDMLDITIDIEVLEQMLKRDGLTKNSFASFSELDEFKELKEIKEVKENKAFGTFDKFEEFEEFEIGGEEKGPGEASHTE